MKKKDKNLTTCKKTSTLSPRPWPKLSDSSEMILPVTNKLPNKWDPWSKTNSLTWPSWTLFKMPTDSLMPTRSSMLKRDLNSPFLTSRSNKTTSTALSILWNNKMPPLTKPLNNPPTETLPRPEIPSPPSKRRSTPNNNISSPTTRPPESSTSSDTWSMKESPVKPHNRPTPWPKPPPTNSRLKKTSNIDPPKPAPVEKSPKLLPMNWKPPSFLRKIPSTEETNKTPAKLWMPCTPPPKSMPRLN